MRILEVGKFYPPEHGGMETALRDGCRGLANRGHQVEALVAASRASSAVDCVDGILVRRVACLGRIRSLPIVPGLAGALRTALRELDPEVVHLHLPNPSAVLAWRMVGDGRPLVVTYHSDIVRQRWLARLWAPWRARLLRDCKRIVTTSVDLIESSEILRPLKDKCVALPLAIDRTPFEQVTPEQVERARARVGEGFVLFVGRLVYYKGLDVLLDAVAPTDLKLVVVGDGPLRDRLARRVHAEDLSSRVTLLGDIPDERLRAIYHACAVLVLPSIAPSEAFGLVQLEAMACAKPVVASRASGGVASVQEDGVTGVLVEPRDSRALREALQRVVGDAELARRLGQAARRRVLAHYDPARRAARLEEILSLAAGYTPANGRSTTP